VRPVGHLKRSFGAIISPSSGSYHQHFSFCSPF